MEDKPGSAHADLSVGLLSISGCIGTSTLMYCTIVGADSESTSFVVLSFLACFLSGLFGVVVLQEPAAPKIRVALPKVVLSVVPQPVKPVPTKTTGGVVMEDKNQESNTTNISNVEKHIVWHADCLTELVAHNRNELERILDISCEWDKRGERKQARLDWLERAEGWWWGQYRQAWGNLNAYVEADVFALRAHLGSGGTVSKGIIHLHNETIAKLNKIADDGWRNEERRQAEIERKQEKKQLKRKREEEENDRKLTEWATRKREEEDRKRKEEEDRKRKEEDRKEVLACKQEEYDHNLAKWATSAAHERCIVCTNQLITIKRKKEFALAYAELVGLELEDCDELSNLRFKLVRI